MPERWLFSRNVDLAVFFGTALVSLIAALLLSTFGGAELSPLAWLISVVFIDVAHVWATLFRVYLDREELERRPMLYASAPLIALCGGLLLHAQSSQLFWRVLAYFAVWHFVRQQIGWMVLYGRRAKSSDADLRWDRAVIYAATLGPIIWWHSNLPRAFWWFRPNDFIDGLPWWLGDAALALDVAVLFAWLVRVLLTRQLHVGKLLLLIATWVVWFGGIVVARDDVMFTVLNVALHGVPYMALLFRYARGRSVEVPRSALSALLRGGVATFLTFLFAIAFLEELVWDTTVWHEHATFFGSGGLDLPAGALTLMVPLLSVPQVTHYLLDGFIWKTKHNPQLSRRLGWVKESPA